ncbi:MAG: hypothetical protein HOP04_02040 [Methylophilaceae bacterium]|nr:hypothetical protein [Methylophilaceae bacterium]
MDSLMSTPWAVFFSLVVSVLFGLLIGAAAWVWKAVSPVARSESCRACLFGGERDYRRSRAEYS